MRTSRIETLADGIFAISMTLLVLDLKVPELAANLSLHQTAVLTFAALGSKLLSFVISFVMIGIYWGAHHMLFDKVHRADHAFTRLNTLFLLTVSIVPFSAAFLGSYPLVQFVQIVYASNLLITGFTLFLTIHYAVLRHRLVDQADVSQEFRINVTGKFVLPGLSYVLAIITSFFNTHLSIVFLALGPIIYLIPIDSWLWRNLSGARWKLPAV